MKRIVKTVTSEPAREYLWPEYAKPFTAVPDVLLEAPIKLIPRTKKQVLISSLHRLSNRTTPTALSARSIARDWGMRPQVAQHEMEYFEAEGVIIRAEGKFGTAVKYKLNLVQLARWLARNDVFPREQVRVPGGTGGVPEGTGRVPGGSTPRPSQIPDGGDPLPDPGPGGNTPSQGPGTGRVSYPNKIGKKYKNGRHGAFCTHQGCGRELAKGEGFYIVTEDGAVTYCPDHIHDAEVRWKLTRAVQGLGNLRS